MTETYTNSHITNKQYNSLSEDRSQDFTTSQSKSKSREYTKKDRSQAICDIDAEKRICPECNNEDLVLDRVTGDLICTACGLVVDASAIFTDESAVSFNNLEAQQTPKSYHRVNHTPSSKKLTHRLQKAEKWTHTWADVHMIIVKKEINRFIYELGLPSYIEESASNLYKKVYKKNAIQGRGIKAMVAAVMYISCRQHHIPVFFQDIESFSKAEHSTIHKCFTFVMETFNITLPLLQPKNFVPKLVDRLGFSDLMEKVSLKILDKLQNSALGNKINNPKHIAAISIFFAYNIMRKAKKLEISITQKAFSQKVGMSETTLRKYKNLLQRAITVHY